MKNLQIVLVFILVSCTKEQTEYHTINGDLYYTWFDFGSFYNYPDSVLENVLLIQLENEEAELIAEDSLGYIYFKLLQENDLLTSPWINLRVNDDSTVKLFMDKSEYEVFTKVSHEQLLSDNEKINVTARVQHLTDNLFKCIEVMDVKRLEGRTFILNGNRKFTVSDYK
ncbi:MAG: hypothetical protein ABJG47_06795 [Ekhidna sp.]